MSPDSHSDQRDESFALHDTMASISRETCERLEIYVTLLQKWQAKINLVSPSTLPDAWNRHIRDSAQLSSLIPRDAKTLYDLGSGAGFPGLVLAILHPDIVVHLIESDSKKCAFLQAVSRETDARVIIHNDRIEAVAKTLPAPDLISARALASLDKLLGLCSPWIYADQGPVFIFPKGAQANDEIAEAAQNWDFSTQKTRSQTDPAATILRLTNVRSKT